MTDGDLDVIEYYDPIRQTNISIITKQQDGVTMVQAISMCYKDNPFPLGELLNIETKTFISMPPGMRGVPLMNGIPEDHPFRQHKKHGCNGCGGNGAENGNTGEITIETETELEVN